MNARVLWLADLTASSAANEPAGIPLLPGAERALAVLLRDAFTDTVDAIGDEAACLRKATAILGGTYGPLRISSSFAMPGNPLPGAVVCTDFPGHDGPTIAAIAVRPDRQRLGIALRLLQAALLGLRLDGEVQAFAAISPGNEPSEALFSRAGFRPVLP